ncbi:hypothetical protein Q3C33_13245 [Enterococcus faecium]|nr:hypothetical protein [Enterococcus faecium]MDQ8341462.1 hypothetical protein [Enterococcus faecium]MDQ8348427.1 hypothetical protein [Enterococcus faecium]MDQ8525961.1 hypothetical protein [Enterococcus faecium]
MGQSARKSSTPWLNKPLLTRLEHLDIKYALFPEALVIHDQAVPFDDIDSGINYNKKRSNQLLDKIINGKIVRTTIQTKRNT